MTVVPPLQEAVVVVGGDDHALVVGRVDDLEVAREGVAQDHPQPVGISRPWHSQS